MCYEKNSTEGFKMNLIQKSSSVLLILASQVYGSTLENFNTYIQAATHPTTKQNLICEREASIIKKNPQECLKAVDMFLSDRKKVTNKTTLRLGYFGTNTSVIIAEKPDIYNQTDKEYIDEKIASAYLNAGVIYDNLQENNLKVKMYQKALEYNPNHKDAHYNLGQNYYFGEGVESNMIKAYEHWRIAAKLGDLGAEKNLGILCRKSPWACK